MDTTATYLLRRYWPLLLGALVWRAIFWPASQGSYTDGILQLESFRFGMTFWPPLFALLARALAWLPGLDLEQAGRLVAMLSAVALMAPLAWIAQRLYGGRAALWTLVAWLASPMALRWSLQPMTDMPMLLFWTLALALLLAAVQAYMPGLFPPPPGAAQESAPLNPLPDAALGFRLLLLASFAGALAMLTRFQGALLAPPLLLATWGLARYRTRGLMAGSVRGPLPWLALLPWLAVPLWMVRQGLAPLANHFAQIGERASPLGFTATLVQVYWFLFEEFLLKSPYFVTYGIFGFLLYGLFRTQWGTARLRWAGWLALYLTLAVLVLQSVFTSYQSRYLLPLLPLVCLFAGHGLAVWERHCGLRSLRFLGLGVPALGFGLGFSALVAVQQGNPFKDLKDAAHYVRDEVKPAAGARLLTNERYGAMQLIGPKTAFWSEWEPVIGLDQPLRPGDVLIVSSYETGSLGAYQRLLREIEASGRVELVKRFARQALPLDPDIMQESITHQNPLAWQLRYNLQVFETAVLRVPGAPPVLTKEQEAELLSPLPAPKASGPSAREQELLGELQDLQRQVEGQRAEGPSTTGTQPTEAPHAP